MIILRDPIKVVVNTSGAFIVGVNMGTRNAGGGSVGVGGFVLVGVGCGGAVRVGVGLGSVGVLVMTGAAVVGTRTVALRVAVGIIGTYTRVAEAVGVTDGVEVGMGFPVGVGVDVPVGVGVGVSVLVAVLDGVEVGVNVIVTVCVLVVAAVGVEVSMSSQIASPVRPSL